MLRGLMPAQHTCILDAHTASMQHHHGWENGICSRNYSQSKCDHARVLECMRTIKLPAMVRALQIAVLKSALRQRHGSVRALVFERVPICVVVAPEHEALAKNGHRMWTIWLQILHHSCRVPAA